MEQSNIQWTDYTWNPWHGCHKVSVGCKFCYMYRDKDRYGHDPNAVVRSSKAVFNKPLKLAANTKVFTCSWSDFFIEEADDWRPEAWAIIKSCPDITFQILTKRPERIKECLPPDWGEGYSNVWLGISAETYFFYHERISLLVQVPAKICFVSLEPLLEKIKLYAPVYNKYVHWIIVGGESGNDSGKYQYRESYLSDIEDIVEQAKQSEIPVFVKQLGTYLSKVFYLKDRHGGDASEWCDKIKAKALEGVIEGSDKYIIYNDGYDEWRKSDPLPQQFPNHYDNLAK